MDRVRGRATARTTLDILRGYASAPRGRRTRIVLRFLASPVAISGRGRVEAITICRNELRQADDGALQAEATSRRETIPCGLVFRSIGYLGRRVPGVPFDEGRGTIPNSGGRVRDPETGAALDGEYVAGWTKRGPTGIIGMNKRDAGRASRRSCRSGRNRREIVSAAPEPAVCRQGRYLLDPA